MSNICDIHEIEDMEIILSDGCRLSARVWMPIDANVDPVPAILEYLPSAYLVSKLLYFATSSTSFSDDLLSIL